MLVLPIPLVAALLMAFLFVHAVLRGDRPWAFATLLAVMALQGVLISLVHHYGVDALRLLQPVTATLVPPLAWLTFKLTAVGPMAPGRDLPHLALPLVTLFVMLIVPAGLDALVSLAFLAYALAILWCIRRGADGLPRTRLETGNRPRLIWAGIASGLALSGVSDVVIAAALAADAAWLRPVLISATTALSIVLVGLLVLSESLRPPAEPAVEPPPRSPAEGDDDARLMAELDALMRSQRLYLDAGLTLERLARRLVVPAKRLSAAVNRATGENVSRYVNGHRIRHACERLAAGDTVTTAMLESGFNTKSNFNREFLRVTGEPPTAWIDRHRG